MCSMQLKTQSEGVTIFMLQFRSIIYVGHLIEMRFTLMQNKKENLVMCTTLVFYCVMCWGCFSVSVYHKKSIILEILNDYVIRDEVPVYFIIWMILVRLYWVIKKLVGRFNFNTQESWVLDTNEFSCLLWDFRLWWWRWWGFRSFWILCHVNWPMWCNIPNV